MSAHPIIGRGAGVEVVIRVKCGDTNTARASTGKDAVSASSTNSPYYAALAAAVKYFGGKNHVSLALIERGALSSPEIYTAKIGEMRTITFHDDGQDFLWWTINADGQIVDCGPFQASIWTKLRVVDHTALKIGDCPRFVMADGRVLTLIHAIARIRKGGVA